MLASNSFGNISFFFGVLEYRLEITCGFGFYPYSNTPLSTHIYLLCAPVQIVDDSCLLINNQQTSR